MAQVDAEIIRKLPYFRNVEHSQLERIASTVHEISLGRGDVLFTEGEPCRGLYFVIEGSIKVSRISPEGRQQALIVIGPHQTFNDVPVFDGGPSPATATAMETSLVGLIPTQVIRNLARENPAIAEAMLGVFAARLRGLTALVADLTHLDVVGRVVKVILAYHTSSGQISLRLGREDLASMVGTTREVASRALRSLEERGCIAREGSRLEIISPERLAKALEESTR